MMLLGIWGGLNNLNCMGCLGARNRMFWANVQDCKGNFNNISLLALGTSTIRPTRPEKVSIKLATGTCCQRVRTNIGSSIDLNEGAPAIEA